MKEFKEMLSVGLRTFKANKKLYLFLPIIYPILLVILKIAKQVEYADRYNLKAGRHGIAAFILFGFVYHYFSLVMLKCCSDIYKKKKINILYTIIVSIVPYIKYTWNAVTKVLFRTKKEGLEQILYRKISYIQYSSDFKKSTMESEKICNRLYEIVNIFKKVYLYEMTRVIPALIIPGFYMHHWIDSGNLVLRVMAYLILAVFIIYFQLKYYLTIYLYHVVLWNEEWEKTYADILARNEPAPNIKTIPFPNL